DIAIIVSFMSVTMLIGLVASRRGSRDSASFFLGARRMPWWLLGMSMVATTFSTDTPNLVTDIVRTEGVSGNWSWWSFLLTGMLTTFVFARLWQRLGVTTDIEFYEKRYSGKAASFLRGFRAIYLGVFFNVMIIGLVTLAAIKIGGVMIGLSPEAMVLVAGLVTVVFSAASGFIGVVITDLVLFVIAMAGAITAAWFALDHPMVGGLEGLKSHPAVSGNIGVFPDFGDASTWIPLFLVPLAVQWWAAWYPGSEPGGGGYVAQRMLAARNESHAVRAVAFFNLAHYALRPWPWIIVALASLIVYPDLDSLRVAMPQVDPAIIGNDLAYPAMLTLLPAGVLGFVVASLVSAYISTVSSHLNWGASYIVNDVYARFIDPSATPRRQVLVARLSTIGLMAIAALIALALESAFQAFRLILTIGAGTGLLFILRWFWNRINAWSEISAMVFSLLVSVTMEFVAPVNLEPWEVFLVSVGLTTAGWVGITLLTRAEPDDVLASFHASIRAAGSAEGFRREIRLGIGIAVACAVFIYSLLFGMGAILFGGNEDVAVWLGLAAISATAGTRLSRMSANVPHGTRS
ncbi:MAG: Na+:solute symporter, partial [Gammaproteobacteria bacterium]|nr:Na+:solute symporter [Gammaproteobacteria bacterium]